MPSKSEGITGGVLEKGYQFCLPAFFLTLIWTVQYRGVKMSKSSSNGLVVNGNYLGVGP